MEARRELIEAVGERYRAAGRIEKKQILDEFAEIVGYHRKYAIRVLRTGGRNREPTRSQCRRIYNEAVVTALTMSGKRQTESVESDSRPLSHVCEIDGALRTFVFGPGSAAAIVEMSAATIDRLLRPVREVAKQRRRRRFLMTPLRKSISIRTFNDWKNPPPGYFEMDMVAHCGNSVAGNHVHSLVLTHIACGWTEAAALIVREQTLITRELLMRFSPDCRSRCWDWMWITTALSSTKQFWAIARNRELELTRSLAYKKNDHAWIEQRNGAVVRKLVGYGRLEGADATIVLANCIRWRGCM